jgi:hypothetical protein
MRMLHEGYGHLPSWPGYGCSKVSSDAADVFVEGGVECFFFEAVTAHVM